MFWKVLCLLSLPTMLIPSGMCHCEFGARRGAEHSDAHDSHCTHNGHQHACSSARLHVESEPQPHDDSTSSPSNEHDPDCPAVVGGLPAARLSAGEAIEISLLNVSLPLPLPRFPATTTRVSRMPSAICLGADGPPLYLSLRALLI